MLPMRLLENLKHDLPAGIVVVFVAVPLCLGIALASGAPLFAGLISGIIGGIVVGSLSQSPLGVSGPAAGLAVIVATAIQSLGSFEAFLLAVVFSGLIQVALGLGGGGVLAYFFPSAVIKGMLAGIGLLIVLKQIPHAVGWDHDPEGDYFFLQPDGETTFSEILRAAEHVEPSAILVSLIALAILVGWERWLTPRGGFFTYIQGPIVAVAFGIGFQLVALRLAPGWALSSEHLVDIPVASSISELGALFVFPDWSQFASRAIWVTALTIAAVASIETLLCVEATDKLDPQKRVTPANRELVAQGVGNALSGLIGGLPVTQVIVRSSANIQSGARTKLSAIIHGLLLLVLVFVLPQVLNLVPLAVLASILFLVGYKLARPSLFAAMHAQGRSQFGPFMATIAGILLTDLLTGVAVGFAAAVLVILHRNYVNSHSLEFEQHDEPDGRHIATLELGEHVSFLSRGEILRKLSEIPDGSGVVLDMRRSAFIDVDVLEILDDFRSSAGERKISVEVRPQPQQGAPLAA
jgi:MFS superfamily sulfate permease-like transporter